MRMDMNKPVTKEQHEAADKEYREVVRSQKTFINELADKLDAGEKLDALARKFAAAVLRGAANGMSEERKRPKGQSKVPDEVAALVASDVVFGGYKKYPSMERWAETYGVDIASIQKVLGKVEYESIKKSMEISRDKKDDGTGLKWIPKKNS